MKNSVCTLVELTGTSAKSIEDALAQATQRAHEKVKHLDWFEVVEAHSTILQGKVNQWHVTIKVGSAVIE
jgi:dodecin